MVCKVSTTFFFPFCFITFFFSLVDSRSLRCFIGCSCIPLGLTCVKQWWSFVCMCAPFDTAYYLYTHIQSPHGYNGNRNDFPKGNGLHQTSKRISIPLPLIKHIQKLKKKTFEMQFETSKSSLPFASGTIFFIHSCATCLLSVQKKRR